MLAMWRGQARQLMEAGWDCSVVGWAMGMWWRQAGNVGGACWPCGAGKLGM
jgi:hypothetical protein